MKKTVFVTLLTFIGLGAYAQSWTPAQYTQSKGVIADSVLRVPRIDTVAKGGNKDSLGMVLYREEDDNYYGKKKGRWAPFATGNADLSDYPTKAQVNDSLSRKVDTVYWNSTNDTLNVHTGRSLYKLPVINWNTLLTPLLTQPAIPIQPTNTVPEALGRLQSQFSSTDGLYIKLTSATAQTGTSAYIQGKLNIKSNTGTTYGLMIERANMNTDDNLIGFKSVSDTVARIGLINRSFNHLTIDNLKDKIRQAVRDTSCIELITLNPDNTGKIGFRFNNGKVQLGDSLTAAKVMPAFPLHIVNGQDTSIYALHKIYTASTIHAAGGGAFGGLVTGVAPSLGDNSPTLITSAWLRSQNYTTAQTLQQVTTTGNTTTNRVIVNATAASAYAGTFSNTGSGSYHGLYVNIDNASTGTPFRVDKNAASLFEVENGGRVKVTGANGYAQFRLVTNYTPTSSADANGLTGDIAKDDNFIYLKTSTGWKRAALTTF